MWLTLSVTFSLSCAIAQNLESTGQQKEIVYDLKDSNRTQYLEQSPDLKAYVFGYDVQANGQFHHENRGPDGVTYGCYGHLQEDGTLQATHYISDGWGFRVVKPGQSVELFLHKHEPDIDAEAATHHGTETPYEQLFFPEGCGAGRQPPSPSSPSQNRQAQPQPGRPGQFVYPGQYTNPGAPAIQGYPARPTGQQGPGQPVSGQPGSGQPISGQPSSGQPAYSQPSGAGIRNNYPVPQGSTPAPVVYFHPLAQSTPRPVQPSSYPGSQGSYPGSRNQPSGSPNQPSSYTGIPKQPSSYPGSLNQPSSYPGSSNQPSYSGSPNQPSSYPGRPNQPSSYQGSPNQPSYSGISPNQPSSYPGSPNQPSSSYQGSPNQPGYPGKQQQPNYYQPKPNSYPGSQGQPGSTGQLGYSTVAPTRNPYSPNYASPSSPAYYSQPGQRSTLRPPTQGYTSSYPGVPSAIGSSPRNPYSPAYSASKNQPSYYTPSTVSPAKQYPQPSSLDYGLGPQKGETAAPSSYVPSGYSVPNSKHNVSPHSRQPTNAYNIPNYKTSTVSYQPYSTPENAGSEQSLNGNISPQPEGSDQSLDQPQVPTNEGNNLSIDQPQDEGSDQSRDNPILNGPPNQLEGNTQSIDQPQIPQNEGSDQSLNLPIQPNQSEGNDQSIDQPQSPQNEGSDQSIVQPGLGVTNQPISTQSQGSDQSIYQPISGQQPQLDGSDQSFAQPNPTGQPQLEDSTQPSELQGSQNSIDQPQQPLNEVPNSSFDQPGVSEGIAKTDQPSQTTRINQPDLNSNPESETPFENILNIPDNSQSRQPISYDQRVPPTTVSSIPNTGYYSPTVPQTTSTDEAYTGDVRRPNIAPTGKHGYPTYQKPYQNQQPYNNQPSNNPQSGYYSQSTTPIPIAQPQRNYQSNYQSPQPYYPTQNSNNIPNYNLPSYGPHQNKPINSQPYSPAQQRRPYSQPTQKPTYFIGGVPVPQRNVPGNQNIQRNPNEQPLLFSPTSQYPSSLKPGRGYLSPQPGRQDFSGDTLLPPNPSPANDNNIQQSQNSGDNEPILPESDTGSTDSVVSLADNELPSSTESEQYSASSPVPEQVDSLGSFGLRTQNSYPSDVRGRSNPLPGQSPYREVTAQQPTGRKIQSTQPSRDYNINSIKSSNNPNYPQGRRAPSGQVVIVSSTPKEYVIDETTQYPEDSITDSTPTPKNFNHHRPTTYQQNKYPTPSNSNLKNKKSPVKKVTSTTSSADNEEVLNDLTTPIPTDFPEISSPNDSENSFSTTSAKPVHKSKSRITTDSTNSIQGRKVPKGRINIVSDNSDEDLISEPTPSSIPSDFENEDTVSSTTQVVPNYNKRKPPSRSQLKNTRPQQDRRHDNKVTTTSELPPNDEISTISPDDSDNDYTTTETLEPNVSNPTSEKFRPVKTTRVPSNKKFQKENDQPRRKFKSTTTVEPLLDESLQTTTINPEENLGNIPYDDRTNEFSSSTTMKPSGKRIRPKTNSKAQEVVKTSSPRTAKNEESLPEETVTNEGEVSTNEYDNGLSSTTAKPLGRKIKPTQPTQNQGRNSARGRFSVSSTPESDLAEENSETTNQDSDIPDSSSDSNIDETPSSTTSFRRVKPTKTSQVQGRKAPTNRVTVSSTPEGDLVVDESETNNPSTSPEPLYDSNNNDAPSSTVPNRRLKPTRTPQVQGRKVPSNRIPASSTPEGDLIVDESETNNPSSSPESLTDNDTPSSTSQNRRIKPTRTPQVQGRKVPSNRITVSSTPEGDIVVDESVPTTPPNDSDTPSDTENEIPITPSPEEAEQKAPAMDEMGFLSPTPGQVYPGQISPTQIPQGQVLPYVLPFLPVPSSCPCYMAKDANSTTETTSTEKPASSPGQYVLVLFVPYCPGKMGEDSMNFAKTTFPNAFLVPYACNQCNANENAAVSSTQETVSTSQIPQQRRRVVVRKKVPVEN